MIQAVEHMCPMRGGAQSHLILCSDGYPYVVKFQNNPQHPRVLANELLATRLAEEIGLTVPVCQAIEVNERFVANTAGLEIEMARGLEPCQPGLHFGSRFAGGLMTGLVRDYLDEEELLDVTNLCEFAGVLALDKWTGNLDGRQAVFARKLGRKRCTAYFIDQGYCFGAGEWRIEDAPLRGVYGSSAVYRHVVGWRSFEPWLSRIESMEPEKIWSIAKQVPPEWTVGEGPTLDRLVEQLVGRRGRVRELIADFRKTARDPFPNWSEDNNARQEQRSASGSPPIRYAERAQLSMTVGQSASHGISGYR